MAGATSQKVLRTQHWKRLRADWALRIAAGDLVCYRCGQLIAPGQPWDLGHVIDRARGGSETNGGVAPEHRSCNRSAGAELGLALRAEREQIGPRIVSPPGDDDALFGISAPDREPRPTSLTTNTSGRRRA